MQYVEGPRGEPAGQVRRNSGLAIAAEVFMSNASYLTAQ